MKNLMHLLKNLLCLLWSVLLLLVESTAYVFCSALLLLVEGTAFVLWSVPSILAKNTFCLLRGAVSILTKNIFSHLRGVYQKAEGLKGLKGQNALGGRAYRARARTMRYNEQPALHCLSSNPTIEASLPKMIRHPANLEGLNFCA